VSTLRHKRVHVIVINGRTPTAAVFAKNNDGGVTEGEGNQKVTHLQLMCVEVDISDLRYVYATRISNEENSSVEQSFYVPHDSIVAIHTIDADAEKRAGGPA
jgi:hypothetical protein